VNHDRFAPTWTGSEETGTSRFGDSGTQNGRFGGGTGGAFDHSESSAGVSRSKPGFGRSSSNLLASLRERNEEIESGGASSKSNGKNKQYTDLLVRIREFVQRNAPTTDEILAEFSSIPQRDAAVFRRLLNSAASAKEGRWRLKPSKGR
jgi:hypothetical protein